MATVSHQEVDCAPVSLDRPPSNLSLPRSPLIDREHQIAAIQQLLLQEQVGLLTLTGPGGIGKTRLALQVAANLLDHFVDGVFVISLAPIRDPPLVVSTIAQTLGVCEASGRPLLESVGDYLQDRQVLLVLDNFEQVLPAAPLVAVLLARCRRLKVCVTSRTVLHLYGEHEFLVPPLALPDAKQLASLAADPVSSLAQVAAVTLFVQRAMAIKADFALTAANATPVAAICLALDGLPLAIELAAAKVKLFSAQALLAGLKQRLALLTGGPHDLPARQRTLRDEIAWSYDLLTRGEQSLFRRLSVFVGGFTLEAAQAVGDAAGALGVNVLDGVAALVDQSLLHLLDQADGEPRFGMLETIRAFGLEQLAASGEAAAISRQHASFFLRLAEVTEPELLGPNRGRGLARLAAELDNLRSVLAWSQTAEDGHEVGLCLAGVLTWFWHFTDQATEARSWLEPALNKPSTATAGRAKALWGAGMMAMIQADYPVACAQFEESIALWRHLEDQHGLAAALRELCIVTQMQGQFIAAQRYGEESVSLFRTLGSRWELALALQNLGHALNAQGDYAAALVLFAESEVLFRAVGDSWGLATALMGLGMIAGHQGDDETARSQFEEALAALRAKGDKWNTAQALNLLGEVVLRQGETQRAHEHLLECLNLAHEVGDKVLAGLALHHLGVIAHAQRQYNHAARLCAAAAVHTKAGEAIFINTLTSPADFERAIAVVWAQLGAEAFAARWAEGQALTLEHAIDASSMATAMAESAPSSEQHTPTASTSRYRPAGLTAREVEVLQLWVQGLTYIQIADALVISRRTVNAHVTSIYSKLGVTSRTAAMRFAADHHLV